MRKIHDCGVCGTPFDNKAQKNKHIDEKYRI